MFTLKFFKYYEDQDAINTNVISCPHYETYERSNGLTTVTTFKNMLDTDGVERHLAHESVMKDLKPDGECFVENSDGKTINTIRPKINGKS